MLVIERYRLLKQFFGHDKFRPGQEALVDALLSGQDALGVMPTGAGKSVCYQLPALLLPGLTLVISPLISLMKDQVAALSQNGVASAYINSSLTYQQYNEVFHRAKNGAYKIIYVAPERLTTADFLQFARETEISLLAVDEAHCVSQWGQDFRPSYLQINTFLDALPQRPAVGAFTATATAAVKADIETLLHLQGPLQITTGFDRPNLYFEVVQPKSKDAYLHTFLSSRPGQSGIVYCATRKTVESVCEGLRQSGVAATRYHAGLDDEERKNNQEDFVYDRARIMVATNAFGMGIDKSNVSFVVHYNMPKNMESYYQEAGRAGRDGGQAHCVLLFSPGDVQMAKFLIHNAEETGSRAADEKATMRQLDLQRLTQVVGYCKTTDCLRTYLLNYFGEATTANCDNCGSCAGETVRQDITVDAQKILSAVARVEKKYPSGLGLTLIVRMLHGSKEQRAIQLGLDKIPTYGILHYTERTTIRDYIDYLVTKGYLMLTEGEYPVLRITGQAKRVLFAEEKVIYAFRKQSKAEKTALRKKESDPMQTQADETLLAALKALRTKLSLAENVPAYIVFSNATLVDMAAKQPRNMSDFLQVSGVGEIKASRYGDAFLAEIMHWVQTSSLES